MSFQLHIHGLSSSTIAPLALSANLKKKNAVRFGLRQWDILHLVFAGGELVFL